MKPKPKTILFIAVLALVATPQAWQRFRSSIAAAQNRVEVAGLNAFLSFHGQPTASENAPVRCPHSAVPRLELATNEMGVESRVGHLNTLPATFWSRIEQKVDVPGRTSAPFRLMLNNHPADKRDNSARAPRDTQPPRRTTQIIVPQVAQVAEIFNDPAKISDLENLARSATLINGDKMTHLARYVSISPTGNTVSIIPPLPPVPARAAWVSLNAWATTLAEKENSRCRKAKKEACAEKSSCQKIRLTIGKVASLTRPVEVNVRVVRPAC